MALDTSAPFFVAYSGGMDSTVLLDAIAKLNLNLTVLHVDHGIQKDSKSWYEYCEKQGKSLGVRFEGVHLKVKPNKKIGLEASARNARYDWFRQVVPDNGYLLTAHHQRDQAETLLFNLLRGAGINGMTAMSKFRNVGQLNIVRPLLDIAYSELLHYADQQQLKWIDDPSNDQLEFSRNKIRHNILPVLKEFRADAVAMINRAATNISESKQLIDEIVVNDLASLKQTVFNPLDHSFGLSLSELSEYSRTRTNHILRYWLEKTCQISVSRQLLHSLCEWVNNAPSTTTILQESGTQFRCFAGVLYVMPELVEKPDLNRYEWKDVKQPLSISELGIKLCAKEGLYEYKNINIVFRHEDLVISEKGKVIKLKELMMQRKIPPWLRYRVPLLVTEDEANSQFSLIEIIENNENNFCTIELIK